MKATDMGRLISLVVPVLIVLGVCLENSPSFPDGFGQPGSSPPRSGLGGVVLAGIPLQPERSVAPVGSLALEEPGIQSPPAGESAEPSQPDPYELQKLFVDTLHQIERNYVTKVDRRRLIEAAIRGMLSELDPHSSYLPADRVGDFRDAVESQFGGIGLQVGIENGRPRVISPLLDTPAYRAGISAGDWILEIDGKNTEGMPLDDIIHQLKGPPGTSVRIKIRHNLDGRVEELTLTRELIHVPTVLGFQRGPDDRWEYFLDRAYGIAYVRLTTFGRPTAEELRRVLQDLLAQGMKALVLDLRFNPGGLLSTAVATADLFIREGVIVSVRGRNTAEQVWSAHSEGTLPDFPLAVLVNRYSASGSEIVAAALQDHGRAVIIGERTWGKGSVQNLIPLQQAGSALKLTTASYRRPSGKPIHRFPNSREEDDWGVRPDPGFEIRLTPQQLAGLMAEQRRREIIPPKPPALAEARQTGADASLESPNPLPASPAQGSQEGGNTPLEGGIAPQPKVENPTPSNNPSEEGKGSQGNSPGKDIDAPPHGESPATPEPGSPPTPPGTEECPNNPDGTEGKNPADVAPSPSKDSLPPTESGPIPPEAGPGKVEPAVPVEPGDTPPGSNSPATYPEPSWSFDPQLAKAVEYLREKLSGSSEPGPIASAQHQ